MKVSHTNSQYTPTYHRLWNKDFTMLIAAELLLCTSCYMTVPFFPYRLISRHIVDMSYACMAILVFVIGMIVSGFFSSWTIQRYRRNKVFCLSTIFLAFCIIGMYLFEDSPFHIAEFPRKTILSVGCFVCGIFFGNAKRVLSCTLLIDKTESCHRTEANYTAIWIARYTVVGGPLCVVLLKHEMANLLIYSLAVAAAAIAILLVSSVKFPFRAPEEDVHIISCDRFFLLSGWNVAFVIATMSCSLGITMSTRLDLNFCYSLFAGLAISMIILKFAVVRNGKHTSLIGNTCLLLSLLAMALHTGLLDQTLKPMLMGLGYGLTSSQQLYNLLDHSGHCQRSTAESTYFISSDGGLFLGIASGLYFKNDIAATSRIAILIFAISALMCSINAAQKKKKIGFHAD